MKKILKKIIMSTLALMVTVGFVHSSSIDADAASKTYSGYVLVSSKMPSCASGEIIISQGNASASTGWVAPTKTSKQVKLTGTAKSGTTATINVKAVTSDGTFYTSFTVKAKDLTKNKKFKVTYKTKGIGSLAKITGISVK